MYDREIVLRFFAINEFRQSYTPTIVDFLDDAMYRIYEIPEAKLQLLKAELEKALKNIIEVFGGAPFSRSYFNSGAYRHNNVLFELLTFAFMKAPSIALKKEQTKEAFEKYFKNSNNSFLETDNAYTKEGFHARFESIENLIKEIK
jgi:hypothetical protein